MGDFIGSIGNGIAGLVSGAFEAIGSTLRAMVASADAALPGGMLALVLFVALVATAWTLAKR